MDNGSFLSWIKRNKLSARELAKKLGVSRQTVYCWLARKHSPTTAHLVAMGRIANDPVKPEWFVLVPDEVTHNG